MGITLVGVRLNYCTNWLFDVSTTILDSKEVSESGVSFLVQVVSGIPCLRNSLPLTYDLDGFKSRINK